MRRRGIVDTLLVVVLSLSLFGCATGTTQTTQGPRPAAQVQAQDSIADVLSLIQDVYVQAVAAHDARALTEDPAIHAANRATLLAARDGLSAAWASLMVSKTISNGAPPMTVVRSVLDVTDPLLALANRLGVISPSTETTIRTFIAAARAALAAVPSTPPAGRVVPLS